MITITQCNVYWAIGKRSNVHYSQHHNIIRITELPTLCVAVALLMHWHLLNMVTRYYQQTIGVIPFPQIEFIIAYILPRPVLFDVNYVLITKTSFRIIQVTEISHTNRGFCYRKLVLVVVVTTCIFVRAFIWFITYVIMVVPNRIVLLLNCLKRKIKVCTAFQDKNKNILSNASMHLNIFKYVLIWRITLYQLVFICWRCVFKMCALWILVFMCKYLFLSISCMEKDGMLQDFEDNECRSTPRWVEDFRLHSK